MPFVSIKLNVTALPGSSVVPYWKDNWELIILIFASAKGKSMIAGDCVWSGVSYLSCVGLWEGRLHYSDICGKSMVVSLPAVGIIIQDPPFFSCGYVVYIAIHRRCTNVSTYVMLGLYESWR